MLAGGGHACSGDAFSGSDRRGGGAPGPGGWWGGGGGGDSYLIEGGQVVVRLDEERLVDPGVTQVVGDRRQQANQEVAGGQVFGELNDKQR